MPFFFPRDLAWVLLLEASDFLVVPPELVFFFLLFLLFLKPKDLNFFVLPAPLNLVILQYYALNRKGKVHSNLHHLSSLKQFPPSEFMSQRCCFIPEEGWASFPWVKYRTLSLSRHLLYTFLGSPGFFHLVLVFSVLPTI